MARTKGRRGGIKAEGCNHETHERHEMGKTGREKGDDPDFGPHRAGPHGRTAPHSRPCRKSSGKEDGPQERGPGLNDIFFSPIFLSATGTYVSHRRKAVRCGGMPCQKANWTTSGCGKWRCRRQVSHRNHALQRHGRIPAVPSADVNSGDTQTQCTEREPRMPRKGKDSIVNKFG